MKIARFVVTSVLVLLPVAASAQSSITGVVRDTSGGVLPGVTVEASSPALIEGSKSAVTDANGLYRVVELRPGPYTVTFSLQGFSLPGAPEAQPYVAATNQQIPGITIGVFVFSQLNIQEVTATSGGDAEADFGGTMLKMVPRDGGNQFSGLSQFSYSGSALEAGNINNDLLARHLDPNRVGSLKKYRETGLALGGPIKQ